MYLENLKKFMKYFGEGKRLKLIGFTLLSFAAGCLEFLGIALIYPFILIIIKPDILAENSFYQSWVELSGISNTTINALLIGFGALVLFVVKNIFMIFYMYLQTKFINNWKQAISSKFMKYYLYAGYGDVIRNSAADKLYVVNSLPTQVMANFLMRILNLITNSIIVFMVISLVLIKFPLAGVLTIIFVVSSMLIQNRFFKSKTKQLTEFFNQKLKSMNSLCYEYLNSLKEVKMLNCENVFFDKYEKSGYELVKYGSKYEFYNAVPPYIVEILIVCSLIILGVVISVEAFSNQSAIVASFGLVGAAIFRMAPALNRIQTSIINISVGRTFLKSLLKEYEDCGMFDFKEAKSTNEENLIFDVKIEFRNVSFSYKNSKPVLKDINLEIKKGDFVGIIGLSGAGKSTLTDVLTGLLQADEGEILVDEKKLTKEKFPAFRKLIGYVPQDINVLAKSFRENVAWGVPADKIDDNLVIQALMDAQLNEFVKEFPEGINAVPFIDSKGISQGQKQRLAIARALYRQPEIIILDEATSSLDVKVEHEITDMLSKLKNKKTIIAVAHRLSTLKSCNKLVYLKDGEIVDTGTFKELSYRYPDFENLVKLSKIN